MIIDAKCKQDFAFIDQTNRTVEIYASPKKKRMMKNQSRPLILNLYLNNQS